MLGDRGSTLVRSPDPPRGLLPASSVARKPPADPRRVLKLVGRDGRTVRRKDLRHRLQEEAKQLVRYGNGNSFGIVFQINYCFRDT